MLLCVTRIPVAHIWSFYFSQRKAKTYSAINHHASGNCNKATAVDMFEDLAAARHYF